MIRTSTPLLLSLLFGICLLGLWTGQACAQSRSPAQSQSRSAREPAGTGVPSYARPAPKTLSKPGGSAQTNSSPPGPPGGGDQVSGSPAPGPPNQGNQVPLGGAEWLAGAGAAYALYRLRDEEDEAEDGTDDEMP